MANQTMAPSISTVESLLDSQLQSFYFLLAVAVMTRVGTGMACWIEKQSKFNGKEPPTVPYWIPVLGSLLTFLVNTDSFIMSSVKSFGPSTPFQVQLAGMKISIVSGFKNTEAILKASSRMTTTPGAIFALTRLLGTPKYIIPFYLADDSGIGIDPRPGSRVEPQNRVIYHQQRNAHRFLSGSSLKEMNRRYLDTLQRNLLDLKIPDTWIELPDLYSFIQREVFRASVEAMCGSYILSLNPTLIEDFWTWDANVPTLIRAYPRWLAPTAYRARDKMLGHVKRWHAFAKENSDWTKFGPNDPEWDPFWGSKLVKARQTSCLETKVMDADTIASEDLGLIFAGNTNAVPAIFWLFFHILEDQKLQERVEQIIRSDDILIPSEAEMLKLYDSPLLQSIYAETLRLRVGIAITRTPEQEDFNLGAWRLRKGQLISLMSRTAALDKSVWSTGNPENSHALDSFWAERFLRYPDDPKSGPLREATGANTTTESEKSTSGSNEPRYTTGGLSGAWIPYGGGKRMCPGRHFAKQEILATLIVMCVLYDIELVSHDLKDLPKANMKYYPLGGLPPDRKLPVRIRRRTLGHK